MIPLNTQPPAKPDHDPGGSLVVHSLFNTIQGEGPFAGCPAVFVRLAECNLQCPGCDTVYARPDAPRIEPVALLRMVQAEKGPDDHLPDLIVVTGGEPFRQNCSEFVREALAVGFRVQIETNGTLNPPYGFPTAAPELTVVVSPKAPKVADGIERMYLDRGNVVYKYVLQHGFVHPEDGLPTSVLENGLQPARPPGRRRHTPIYLQPYDDGTGFDSPTNVLNRRAVVRSAKRFGHRAGLQLHKLLGLE